MASAPIPVVAAIIERDGRFLICQRRAGDVLGLRWEFPGGKIQMGETAEKALARELREELDVEASIGALVEASAFTYADSGRTVHLQFFRAEIPPQAATKNLAFERIEWVTRGEILSYDFLPADRFLVERISRGAL